jgi:serine/alanine adding enzyme
VYSIGAVLAEVAPEDWDALCGRAGVADVYYSRGFVAASAPLAGGSPVFLEGEGVLFPLLLRSDPVDAATPYGYGGPLVLEPGGDVAGAYAAWCRRRGVLSTFAVLHPLLDLDTRGFRVSPLGGTVAWALEGDLEAGMHAHHRRQVRRARAAGLAAAATPGPSELDAFVAVYEHTMRRAGAAPFYFFGAPYWEALLRDVPLVRVDVAGEDGVAGSVLGMGRPPVLHYHLGGNTDAGRRAGASQLALLALARWGQEHGFTTLHLGGGVGGRADSLLEFKRRFAPDGLVPSAIGKAVHDEAAYLAAAGAAAVDWDGFFPAYREPR